MSDIRDIEYRRDDEFRFASEVLGITLTKYDVTESQKKRIYMILNTLDQLNNEIIGWGDEDEDDDFDESLD